MTQGRKVGRKGVLSPHPHAGAWLIPYPRGPFPSHVRKRSRGLLDRSFSEEDPATWHLAESRFTAVVRIILACFAGFLRSGSLRGSRALRRRRLV